MKNKIKLLFILIALIPFVVRADMGAPVLRPYEMVVVNPNGIDCKGYQDKVYHISKDDKFTVNFEYKNDGESHYEITYKEDNCGLESLNGTVLVSEELDPIKAINDNDQYIKMQPSPKAALVYADAGVDVKKGPADIYKTVGHLDKNTELKYTYYTSDITHIYVDTGKIQGWVELLDTKVLIENAEKYIAHNEIKLPCTTIQKNTIIKPKYKADAWSRSILVESEGCSKLIRTTYEDISYISTISSKYRTKKEETIYEYAYNEGKELGKIPSNGEFVIYASAGKQGENPSPYYIKYNNITGWIQMDYEDKEYIEDEKLEDEESTITIPEQTDKVDTTTIGAKESIDYVTTYVIIALSLAVIVLIILLLINKKKYKKLTNEVER